MTDESRTLFGFGVDSFNEVISAVEIWHMVHRIRLNGGESRDDFEQLALRITGGSFSLLTAGLIVTAILSRGPATSAERDRLGYCRLSGGDYVHVASDSLQDENRQGFKLPGDPC